MRDQSLGSRVWTTRDSAELFQVQAWGAGYFAIDEKGHVKIQPRGEEGPSISLPELVGDLKRRGYALPILLRFSDILQDRIESLWQAFRTAMDNYQYSGEYCPVFPIKVNQQADVVEELVSFGRKYQLGLEAGSKPELLVALAQMDTTGGVIVCNGYKDRQYIETAMLAQKLGVECIVVIERFGELDTILALARQLNVRPRIGVRARLTAKGAGRWQESSGDRSKFGLTATELVDVVRKLRQEEMLQCLEMLHFHIGSQITSIRAIQDALQEASRIFVELHGMGAGLKFFDVGGGLAVDYDGSKTNFHSSANYSLQEYANDVVSTIQDACDNKGVPHPSIVSESGRALVAHHSVLVFDVLGVSNTDAEIPPDVVESENSTIRDLFEAYRGVSQKNFQESFHDAVRLKEESATLFKLGYLDLDARAMVDKLFWATCRRIRKTIAELEYVPEELEGLERVLADTYYCNFSVFQSVPDHWAVKQLFPVMPIHRLNERPSRQGILADLTCDSDGKVDRFIDLRDVKRTLELHDYSPDEPYYLGMFLVGAYQEILGDLHNLFGDTNAIHLSLDENHGYCIERVVEGDTVSEVLGYVQYDRQVLVRRIRALTEAALRRGDINMEESALLRKTYEDSLAGYTYLSREPARADAGRAAEKPSRTEKAIEEEA